jgi:hypothetical protein
LDPTNKTVEITLTNHRKHALHFDLNTFFQFEEKAGKTLPSFLVELEQAFAPLASKKDAKKNGKADAPVLVLNDRKVAEALGKLSVKDLRALVWAALHEYDAHGEPIWPYTIGQLGGLIDHSNLGKIMGSLMSGVTGSLPRSTQDKEEPKKDARPTNSPETPSSGGNESGHSDEAILSSLEPKSDA